MQGHGIRGQCRQCCLCSRWIDAAVVGVSQSDCAAVFCSNSEESKAAGACYIGSTDSEKWHSDFCPVLSVQCACCETAAEIDSGVSGDVANKVGLLMQEIALSSQVLCITHLPQIASQGKHHYKLSFLERSLNYIIGFYLVLVILIGVAYSF